MRIRFDLVTLSDDRRESLAQVGHQTHNDGRWDAEERRNVPSGLRRLEAIDRLGSGPGEEEAPTTRSGDGAGVDKQMPMRMRHADAVRKND